MRLSILAAALLLACSPIKAQPIEDRSPPSVHVVEQIQLTNLTYLNTYSNGDRCYIAYSAQGVALSCKFAEDK